MIDEPIFCNNAKYSFSEHPRRHTDSDMQEFAEWIGERYFFEELRGIWYLYHKIPMRDPVPMFTTSQLLQEFKAWKEEQK